MSRDPQLRLADIVDACGRIADYIEGLDAASFALDFKTQDAVIRQFAIIGEARRLKISSFLPLIGPILPSIRLHSTQILLQSTSI